MNRPLRHKHPVNQKLVDRRSQLDQAVDKFVAFFGSLRFIAYMTGVIILWIIVNALVLALRWDPYPFILLNLAFSAQATYAAPLILLSQNRSAEHDRLKAEHDYQVNETSLTEIETNTQLTREIHALVQADGGLSANVADLAVVVRAAIQFRAQQTAPSTPPEGT